MKKISRWFDNARSGSLVQSVMPATLAVVLSIGVPGFNLWLAVLAVVGVACAHLALNLADDWFDYRVDMMGDRDRVIRKGFRAMTVKYPYLTDGSETLRSTAMAILGFSLVALVCGGVILAFRFSWIIPAIVAVTAFLGVFYSAPPFKLAYRGLGELIIGVIFGPLLMIGVYYASCMSIMGGVLEISVPVGLLVMNILFTHSFIDMAGDAESNKMTFARLLGTQTANLLCSFLLNFLPFGIVIAAVIVGNLHPIYLIVLAGIPRAVWLYRSLLDFAAGKIDVPSTPPSYLGQMPNWDKVTEAGIGWFLMRWLCARNTLSAFCALSILAKLITLIICR